MADDPTNAERQRLYRARRKAAREGLVEVIIGGKRFWVPAALAERIDRMCDKAASPGHRPNGA
jgi:hypothetical protein